MCFSPDGKVLACSTYPAGEAFARPALQLRDLASGKERFLSDKHLSYASALAFSSDGKVIAAADASGTPSNRGDPLVHLWDTATGKVLCRHAGHRIGIGAVAFSPNGKLVASGAAGTGMEDNSVHVWEAATGRLIRRFEGHHSGVGSVAFSPDGLTVASGAVDSTVLLWDITGRRADGRWHGKLVTPRELDACWIALKDEDAAKAYDAVWRLVASAEQALPLLRKHLRPVPRPDTKIVTQLIADLDSDNFDVRQHAMKELSKLGDVIIPDLRRVLDGKPTLEMRRRLQQLLDWPRDWTPEQVREHRAIQVLEHIGTQEARQLLEALAGGAPEARLTEEAKAALRRR
jgi:dipeptidyl aminopeptidase/acylaminoacyl peptidase